MMKAKQSRQQAATAADVMDPEPTVVKPDDLIRDGIKHIMHHRYRHLPVVDNEGRYLGIFGVNCLLRLILPKATIMDRGLENVSFIYETLSDMHTRLKECEHQPIETCMHKEVEAVYPDTPLIKTLIHLYQSKCPIPVVDPETGKLLGMISYFDVGQHVLSA